MAATLPAIADGLKTLLTATVTAAGGTISRSWLPRFKLEDGEESDGDALLRVVVVPRNEERGLVARRRSGRDYTVDVGVLKRVTGGDADVDTAMEFAESLANVAEANQLASPAGVSLLKLTVGTPSAEHLAGMQQFTAVMTAVYRGVVAL